MLLRRPNLIGLALVAGVGLGACAHLNEHGQSADDDSEDQLAAELRDHHRHHHRGGVTQFMAMSLDTLGEDDAQRPQLEKLQGSLRTCLAPMREIETELVLIYADGLGQPTLPSAKIDDAITRLDLASRAVTGCSLGTMNQLHALLTPAEREVVADKVQAHWEIWREVNLEADAGGKTQGSRLADLNEELNLSTAQLEQMSAALTASFGKLQRYEVKPAQSHVLAFAAAFVFDTFEAGKVMADAGEPFASQGARRMATFYETVSPLLSPAQRTELAELLREHAHHPVTLTSN